MNIVFDAGLKLDREYREALDVLIPADNATLTLDSMTAKTDGTPNIDEGFVFVTDLPVDVMKYHIDFFAKYKNAPQWFFVLVNKSNSGLADIANAARRCDLKNYTKLHAGDLEEFKKAIEKIQASIIVSNGKVLLLSKHERAWPEQFARLICEDSEKYEIMNSANMHESDSEYMILCGENMKDFMDMQFPCNAEPYFVFNIKSDIQFFIEHDELISEIAKCYHMTSERVLERMFFVDIENEEWLLSPNPRAGDYAAHDGVLIWDKFGLPVSRDEYTEPNIRKAAEKSRDDIEKIRNLINR